MKQTLNYYNTNAVQFIENTRDVDFTSIQNNFLKYLPKKAHILDLGCGSGRDSKFFLEHGYEVTAIDGSEELCKLASEYIGKEVKHMLFEELSDIEVYDGIWACSSILHLEKDTLHSVLLKIKDALRNGGYFYTSFKYGEYEGDRNGRYFTDMTEESLKKLISDIPEINIVEFHITEDVRPEREEKWLNVILKKDIAEGIELVDSSR